MATYRVVLTYEAEVEVTHAPGAGQAWEQAVALQAERAVEKDALQLVGSRIERIIQSVQHVLVLAAAVLLCSSAAAQSFHVCVDGRGRYTWSDQECTIVPLAALPCDLVIGLPSCDPPAGIVSFPRLPVPFDGPVRFGSVVTAQARTYWTWTKAGEPSRACTAAERAEQGHYGRGCAARSGDVLFMTPPVYVPPSQ